jgi:hypothetical protein
MNNHSLIDYLAVDLSALLLRKSRMFRDGIESAPFSEHLGAVTLNLPPLGGIGHYEAWAGTLAGALNPALRIAQWKGPGFPTVIYHHGAGENPYDRSFNWIFPVRRMSIPASLVAVRISFNRTRKEYTGALRRLDTFMAMLAVSVRLIEQLVHFARSMGTSRVTVAGVSLGGFVANLHHIFFNSADVYKPIFSGAAMGDLLLYSAYRSLCSPLVLRNAERIRALLNFDDEFARVGSGNVFPLLGRYDQIAVFDRQRRIYDPQRLSVVPRGHTTGLMAVKRLRRHILS